ncbi:MAG: hypothetical protein HOP19_11785 [Acidobacteria bacterium]|nr:hypothetical protein [Acidobacteriota bacterium]
MIPVFLMATSVFLFLLFVLALVAAGGVALARSGNQQIDANRRSFLTGREEQSHALFFGMQMVLQTFGNDRLRAQLAQLVAATEAQDSARAKDRFVDSAVALLLENNYAWEYGFWEYLSDAPSAMTTFNQWRNEIDASMAEDEEEIGSEIDRLHRFSDQKEYLIVTFMFVLDNRDEKVEDDQGAYEFRPTYGQILQPFKNIVENVAERDYFRHETFSNLLYGLRSLDVRAIERDAFFVFPGTAEDGLSTMDLLGEEGWKYLTDHSIRVG